MSYFVGILRGVRDIFLPGYPQVLFLLNVGFKGIYEPHKSPVQRGDFIYLFFFYLVYVGLGIKENENSKKKIK